MTLLEYIEGTGTQYINTNLNPTGNTRVEIKISNNTTSGVVFGAYNGSGSNWWDYGYGFYATVGHEYFRHYYDNYNTQILVGGTVTVDMNKGALTINDSLITDTSTKSFTVDYPMYIFAGNYTGSVLKECCAFYLYSCKIYDGDTLLRDLIPVKDENDVVCMYDKISGTYFRNAGTGNFIAGPEKETGTYKEAIIDNNERIDNIKFQVENMQQVVANLPEAGGTNTMDANALATDIVMGKTAYVQNQKITGAIYEAVPGSFPMMGPAEIIDLNYQPNQVAFSGYMAPGNGVLIRGNAELGSIVNNADIAQALNLQPNQIANGVSIFDVVGTLDDGGGAISHNDMNIICSTLEQMPEETIAVGFFEGGNWPANNIYIQITPAVERSEPWYRFECGLERNIYSQAYIDNVSVNLIGEHTELFTTNTSREGGSLYVDLYGPNINLGEESQTFWMLAAANFKIIDYNHSPSGTTKYAERAIPISVYYSDTSCC